MAVLSATDRLKAMLDADSDPTLSADDIATLLAMSAVPDADGLQPDDAGWTATYLLARGAAEGWRWKAAKVSTRFDFRAASGESFDRSQIHKAMLENAARYEKQIIAAPLVRGGSATTWDPVVA